MGNKPVNYVSWFDAARVSNWYQNGATSSSSTETGAYTFIGGQTSGTPPAVTSGSTGIGSAGRTGNFANDNSAADWDSQNGNVTAVGTNGGASAYGGWQMMRRGRLRHAPTLAA